MAHNQSYQQQHHRFQQSQLSHKIAKVTTAVTLGGSLMVLSSLSMAATIIGLVLVTPLLVIFSPVLVPAVFSFFLILAGFVTTGGLVSAAAFVFYWTYRYASGKHPIGADRLDWARGKIAGAAVEIKHKAEHLGHQTMKEGGSQSHQY